MSDWNSPCSGETDCVSRKSKKNEWRFIVASATGSCIFAAVLFFIIYGIGVKGQGASGEGLIGQSLGRHIAWIECLMQAGLIACVLFAILRRKRKDRYQTFMGCILMMGIIMRIGYMLYTPYSLRGHDVLKECGHDDYIMDLMGGHLPMTNNYQFYHPPLFHMLAAGIALLFGKLAGIQDKHYLLEAGKLISCWASILTLIIARELCRELNLGKQGTAIALILISFLPEQYLLAGRLNNDSLSIMFMSGVLLFTLKWLRTRSLKDLMILALCYGLGVMTKVSVGTFAVVTGIAMLYVFYQNIRAGTGIKCLKQYIVFSAIAFPLGLWYPVRNLILYGQPFTYVYLIESESPLYVGNYGLTARFFPRPDNYLFADPYRDYNVWTYIVRTSVFGEFTYDVPLWIPQLLLICAGLLAAASLFAIGYVFVNKILFRCRSHSMGGQEGLPSTAGKAQSLTTGCQDLLLAAYWVVTLLFYIWFNVKYPFGCTMDFRYIIPASLIGSVLIGRWVDSRGRGIITEYLFYVLCLLTGMFALMSCLMYTLI